MRIRSRATVTVALAGLSMGVLGIAGCGSSDEQEREQASEHAMEKAADRTVCVAQAKQVADLPDGFPQKFPFPPGAVVYDSEDRGDTGVIVTAVTRQPFKQVLAFLNGPVQTAGFKTTEGETEENDAEANWTSSDHRGRWAIRKSPSCAGETTIQVLADAS